MNILEWIFGAMFWLSIGLGLAHALITKKDSDTMAPWEFGISVGAIAMLWPFVIVLILSKCLFTEIFVVRKRV